MTLYTVECSSGDMWLRLVCVCFHVLSLHWLLSWDKGAQQIPVHLTDCDCLSLCVCLQPFILCASRAVCVSTVHLCLFFHLYPCFDPDPVYRFSVSYCGLYDTVALSVCITSRFNSLHMSKSESSAVANRLSDNLKHTLSVIYHLFQGV